MQTSARRADRNPALDGIRALGVLVVMAYHLGLPGSDAGFLGVDLFFVLSGFLITSYLVREWEADQAIGLGRFWMRRLLRLVPALVLMLLICGSLTPRPDQVAAALGLANFAMVLGIVPGMNQRLLVHTWSLASEWQYYLIWPLFFILLMKSRLTRPRAALVVAAVALASGIWRSIAWATTGDAPRVLYLLDTRSDGLLLGTAVALLLSSPTTAERLRACRLIGPATWLALLVTLGVLASGAPFEFFMRGGLLAFVIVVALLLSGVLIAQPRGVVRWLSLPVFVWIGSISYGLYLWHLPIHGYLESVRGVRGLTLVLLTLALSFGAASLSFYLFEKPAMRLKTRLNTTDQAPSARPSTAT
jgi:peptidoglycan/LPS O-acetylase OafA/YrhL